MPLILDTVPKNLCISDAHFGHRVPALNTDPAFIKDMADMVVEALSLPTLTVSEVRAFFGVIRVWFG